MALQISPKDTDRLLVQKNVLSEDVISKYVAAGDIVGKCLNYTISLINESYHLKKHEPYSIAELSLLSDSFMQTLINEYKLVNDENSSIEKSIAFPTSFNVNEYVENFSLDIPINESNNSNSNSNPEIYFKEGDLVNIHLGCQIDGYTVSKSHTIVIYPIENINNNLIKSGPLLGSNANSIIANHLIIESIITLLALSNNPNRIPDSISTKKEITGDLLRNCANTIAKNFNCTIIPGSKIRRIRRFLAGQAEGIVSERDFKGVVWSEKDQELDLLNMINSNNNSNNSNSNSNNSNELVIKNNEKNINKDNSIPTDDFIVKPGEAYFIDIRLTSINENDLGIYTLETINETNLNNILIRDISISEQLKLRNSRKLISIIDKKQSVYPFKLSYLSENYPLKTNSKLNLIEQLNLIKKDCKIFKFGLNECINKHLICYKKINKCKFIKLQEILKLNSLTGKNSFDSNNLNELPGFEMTLPKLGLNKLNLKKLYKSSISVPVSRESLTVLIDNNLNQTIKLGGLTNLEYAKSELNDNSGIVAQLSIVAQDPRFGVKIISA